MNNIKDTIAQGEFSEILNARLNLNPILVRRIIFEFLKNNETSMRNDEEKNISSIYHFNGNFLCPAMGRPDPYFEYIFSNNDFVIYVETNNNDLMIINFTGNLNAPNEQDIENIKNEIFEIIESGKVFLLWDMKKENTKFKIIG
jgi:hypothetical protein